MTNDIITVRHRDGAQATYYGRDAWALRELISVGSKGLTSYERPAPRWSHYVYRLRNAGIDISTDYETHAGKYPGRHGRYRLVTSLTVVVKEAA
jgi:hypothetical protein